LLHLARREGNWPQLWTALRILAELLATLGRQKTAAVLFAAARESPSAPAVSGQDVERYRRLEELISQRTSPDVLDQITGWPAHCHAPKSSTAHSPRSTARPADGEARIWPIGAAIPAQPAQMPAARNRHGGEAVAHPVAGPLTRRDGVADVLVRHARQRPVPLVQHMVLRIMDATAAGGGS
jgi:hypothetical protein